MIELQYKLPIASPDTLGGVRIGDTLEINSDGVMEVKGLNEIKTSYEEAIANVSAGKTLIADAITGKGVPTDSEDTFSTMAVNVIKIKTGGAGNILFDVACDIDSESETETDVLINALCYPDKGRTIKVYVNNNYWGDYTFIGANVIPEILKLNFVCMLQKGKNTIRLVSTTRDIVLLTLSTLENVSLPPLTSNETTVEGLKYKTIASSEVDSSRMAYMPFNGTENLGGYDCWHPEIGAPQWLMLVLPYSARIKSFTMQNRINYPECPKDIIFQGSNDGYIWNDIKSFVFSDIASKGVTKTIETDNKYLYKYYRWYITTVNQNYGVIAKIKNINMLRVSQKEIILQCIV